MSEKRVTCTTEDGANGINYRKETPRSNLYHHLKTQNSNSSFYFQIVMPTEMNTCSPFLLTNSSPAMNLHGRGGIEFPTANMVARSKKESEVIAACALASLVSDDVHPYWYLYCKPPLRPQSSQDALQKPRSKKLELPERITKNGRKRAVPFPLKLMQVLSDEQYSHIVSWMPSGRSFVIIRPRSFVKEILPKHFKSAQYTSFTRKLMRWGFSKCEEGTAEFYHPQFRKDRVDLAEKMTCHAKSSSIEEISKAGKSKLVPSKVVADDSLAEEQSVASAASSRKNAEDAFIEKRTFLRDDETKEVKLSRGTVNSAVEKGEGAVSKTAMSNEEYLFRMEVEQMKLRRYIQAAACSRRALAEMRLNLAPRRIQGSRAFALAAGGFPMLPGCGTSSMLDSWNSVMLSRTSPSSRPFPSFQGSAFTSGSASLLSPNVQIAKTA